MVTQVSVDVEGDIYRLAASSGITLFTVSHRKSLWKHHGVSTAVVYAFTSSECFPKNAGKMARTDRKTLLTERDPGSVELGKSVSACTNNLEGSSPQLISSEPST